MNFLHKAYRQASDLFRGMTPGARVTAGMLLVLIVVSLVYLFVYEVRGSRRYLFGAREFSHEELDAMQQAFGDAGLDQWEIVDNRVQVPGSRITDYLKALSENEFTPQNFDSAIDEMLASNNSLIDSKQLQEFKLRHATQKKLSRVIAQIAGIDNATVQYREYSQGGYPPVVERKATVAVMAKGRKPLEAETVHTIRTTACGWFGLKPEDIYITDMASGRAWGGNAGSLEHGAAEMVYADTKRFYEEYWKNKIHECLTMYPGVTVGVNVELDPVVRNESTKVVIDQQSTAVESNMYTKTTESRPSAAGRPGAVPNGVTSNTPREITTASTQEATSDENRESQVSIPGHEQTLSTRAGLIPKLVTATVAIPKSYFRKLWDQQHPVAPGETPATPDPAELRNLEKEVSDTITSSVASTLPPVVPGENSSPQVQVTTYTDLPPDPIEEPTLTASTLAWLSANWKTLALVAVGLASLVFLRSMIRGSAPSPEEGPLADIVPLPQRDVARDPRHEPEQAPVILQRRSASTGANLRAELAALVREDPDAAANILRSWIGDAA